MRHFSWNFFRFFEKLLSAYIFINCTNLWKFVIIVFNTYLNFIKLSNTSTIIWEASIKFKQVFCKFYTNFIHNSPNFLKNFNKFFHNIPLIFFQNFNKYYSKVFKFLCIFWTVSQSFVDILSIFFKFLKFFFRDLLKVSIKLQLKFVQIFILIYLKIFLPVSEVFLNFFFLILNLFFSQNELSVISSVLIFLYYAL